MDRRGLLLAAALFAATLAFSVAGVTFAGTERLPSLRGRLLLDGGAKLAALAGVALLFRAPASPAPPRPAPLRRAVPAGLLSGLAFLPVAALVMVLQTWILSLWSVELRPQELVSASRTVDGGTFLLIAAFAVVVAPLWEETLFRVHLHSGLRSFLGPPAAALLTAVLFAAIHGDPIAFPVTFLLGLALADLRERTGGRSAPIAMHACYNAWQVGGMLLLRLHPATGG